MANKAILQIAALGAICGLRTMAGPALLARRLQQNPPASWPHPALRRLATEPVPSLLQLAAGGELLADKLPFLPARTAPVPLASRAIAGAAVGAVLGAVENRPWLAGALIGGAAAVAAAFAGYHARRLLAGEDGLPDPLVALLEDGLVLGLGKAL